MGADLICAYVEIEKDKKPKWEAANLFVKQMNEKSARAAFARIQQLDDDEHLEEYYEGPYLKQVVEACKEVQKAYSGVWYRCYSKLYLSKTEVLLAADRTWGDPVPAVDAMQLFVECGAAHVAGFLDCPKVTNKVRAYGKPRPKKEKK